MSQEPKDAANPTRDKSVRLFSYLRELTQLRSAPIRNIDTYESVLWFSDIPQEQECFSQTWGVSRENREDIWLEIKKPKIPSLPLVPEITKKWARDAELIDMTKEKPVLLERILADNPSRPINNDDEDISEGSPPQWMELRDYPDVQAAWSEYVENKWIPWATEYRRAKKVQKIYTALFEIYQTQKNLGEEFETVIGFGFLAWETPSRQTVRRHLITVQASISLDPNRGTLSVNIPADGPRPMLEQDMLEASERPPADIQIKIEELVSQLAEDVWNNAFVEVAARSWVQACSSEGQYDGALSTSAPARNVPAVSYSPALILRKRTERGLLRLFHEIVNQLKAGVDIPLGIARTVEIVEDYPGRAYDGEAEVHSSKMPEEVYFPLPANEEQLRIVEQIGGHQGVLVQGPPGTGKSHTIVNLICHLLATGQRVLVTSQTPRALRVLKEKMQNEKSSRELAPLCVSLLGNDANAMKDLEESVQAITDRHHNWDVNQNEKLVTKYRQELRDYREHLAELNSKLRQLREKETFILEINNGAYKGTAQQIALQLASEKDKYGWIGDEIEEDKDRPVKNKDISKWLSLSRAITAERIGELSSYVIPFEEILTPEQFIKFKEDERIANEIHRNFNELTHDALFSRFKNSTKEQRLALAGSIDELLSCQASILKHRLNWVIDAVGDFLADQNRTWQELFEHTTHHLLGLLDKARKADEQRFTLPTDHERITIIADITALLTHLKKGGGFGFPLFRPEPVRNSLYIIKTSRVDGIPCKTIPTIESLLNALEVDEALDRLWERWDHIVKRKEGGRAYQIQQLEDLCEQLKQLVRLHELVENSKRAIGAIKGLPQPAWHLSNEVAHYRRVLDAISSEEDLGDAKAKFERLAQLLRAAITRPDHHKLIVAGLQSIENRDEVLYGQFYAAMSVLEKDRKSYGERRGIEALLYKSTPELISRISGSLADTCWDTQLTVFESAWDWARAKARLENLNNETTVADIQEDIRSTQKKLELTIGHLAAALAWHHCFRRMTKSEQEHLTAWKQAMKRIGKGTGKHAEKHRQEARKNMQGCRSAIPGWIMPLYKVAETVNPSIGAYDVVIIDEASQAGPEAIFLQYIAKKIVVVGDDMQISPDAVGIPRQDVDLLRERYLKDFPLPHIGALGVEETSFFHLAEILFGGRIVLNEHFRCMPEIIQFSNALCYRNTLIPLRYYPPNRLKPVLQVHHISRGFRKGDTRNPLNQPEADAVVEAIVQCCQNASYRGKTIGVISLLGETQAKYIERRLLEIIGPEEMESRRLICGDAYAFQGDERDVIFLSLVAAPGETEMYAVTGQKFQRRFNVAASRARDQMWLFHTPSINDFRNKEDLRYQLVSFFHDPKTQLEELDGINIDVLRRQAARKDRSDQSLPKPFDSWFEVDVFLQIVQKGYRVLPQFETAGYFIDMVVEGLHGRLGIECDGDQWHGPEQYEADMRRQRMLERCGQKFWRIRGSEYYVDPERALKSLWSLLEDLEILPYMADVKKPEGPIAATLEKREIIVPQPEEVALSNWPSREANAVASASRSRYLEALLAILPKSGKLLRADAIRAAAKAMRDQGLLEFQRVREHGEIWSDFKSAIHSGLRKGVIDGDARYIWRTNLIDKLRFDSDSN
jgi:very-short-patch-repair endonuclease